MDKPKKPHRRVTLRLEIGADGWDEMACSLHCIADEIDRHGKLPPWSVSGGYSSGWNYQAREDEAVDHDSWAEANDAYVKWLRTTPNTPITGEGEGNE